MSVSRSYPLRCPKCGDLFDATLLDSINRKEDPELREALIANKVNFAICPSCEYSFRVDKNLLYHDPENRFMVYAFTGGEARVEEAQREFQILLSALPGGSESLPALHLVLSRIDLIERIFLLESGLDARLIEYIKHLVYLNNRVRIDPAKKRILFDAKDSTEDQLCFVVQDVESGQLEQALTYGRATYRSLAEMFDRDDHTPSIMELFPGPVINARRLLIDPPEKD
ncbi:MAG: CpXC domain-containing protein [Kiritimatiellia bacterium]|nr:CpXC domain-containing protein [Kiritimatiellia bacterium]